MANGEAYAFFYCRQPYAVVNAEFTDICEMAETQGLVLKVFENQNPTLVGPKDDRGLSDIISRTIQIKLNYAVRATLMGATNEHTGVALQDVLNLAYSDPALYESGEPFRAECCYWNGEKFIFG